MDSKVAGLCQKGSGAKSRAITWSVLWHQIIARAMGAKVGRSDKGWEVSVSPVDLTRRGQEIFGRASLVLELPQPNCEDI